MGAVRKNAAEIAARQAVLFMRYGAELLSG